MSKEVKRYRLEHNTPAREVELERDVNILRGTVMITEADFGRAYDALLADLESLKKEIRVVLQEMRERKINGGKNTSPTLHSWADSIDAALQGEQP